MVYWLFLMAAISLEIMGTFSMKLSKGFSNTLPSVLLFVFYGSCLAFLTLALKGISLSTAYSIWSGLGTACIVLIDWLYFKEALPPQKIFFLALIGIGTIGLKYLTPPS